MRIMRYIQIKYSKKSFQKFYKIFDFGTFFVVITRFISKNVMLSMISLPGWNGNKAVL